jgi:hypothetical protein
MIGHLHLSGIAKLIEHASQRGRKLLGLSWIAALGPGSEPAVGLPAMYLIPVLQGLSRKVGKQETIASSQDVKRD